MITDHGTTVSVRRVMCQAPGVWLLAGLVLDTGSYRHSHERRDHSGEVLDRG